MPTPERLLSSTARSTFEALALLFAEPADAAGAALGPDAVGARVAFAGVACGGDVEGALTVRVSAALAASLAENMLGAADPGPAARADAVGELANVVCGHVLSAAGGPAAVFRLAAPEPVGAAAAGAVAEAWLDVEGGAACVALEGAAGLFAEPSAERA